jgi:hypothetical protein
MTTPKYTRVKTKRIGNGCYSFTTPNGKRFEVERGLDASTGYGLRCTTPTWDLFQMVSDRREWVNDFASKTDAVDHAECL